MKIAVISDIHSNYLVFKKAYKDALSKNVDLFLFLGDYVTDGFDANKILDIIKTSNGYAINGNREVSIIEYSKNKDARWNNYLQFKSMKYAYDSLSQENLEYIQSLPIYKILNILNKKICISHSTPYSVRGDVFSNSFDVFDKLIEDYNCDVYLFGHEHKYYYTKYKDKIFINVGSIGLPLDDSSFKYGILTIDNNIKYEKIDITYDYNELENYYKNSDYYKDVTIWCSLLLMTIKSGENYPQQFMNYIYEKAKKENIDVSYAIPNELFISSYQEYLISIKYTLVN